MMVKEIGGEGKGIKGVLPASQATWSEKDYGRALHNLGAPWRMRNDLMKSMGFGDKSGDRTLKEFERIKRDNPKLADDIPDYFTFSVRDKLRRREVETLIAVAERLRGCPKDSAYQKVPLKTRLSKYMNGVTEPDEKTARSQEFLKVFQAVCKVGSGNLGETGTRYEFLSFIGKCAEDGKLMKELAEPLIRIIKEDDRMATTYGFFDERIQENIGSVMALGKVGNGAGEAFMRVVNGCHGELFARDYLLSPPTFRKMEEFTPGSGSLEEYINIFKGIIKDGRRERDERWWKSALRNAGTTQ